MPVIQIDKNGFIRGTNKKHTMKVLTLQSILIKGKRIPKGEQVEIEGADLSYFLNRGQVVPVKEDTTLTVPQTLETETQPSLIKGKKKLGPKKSKTPRQAQGDKE